MIGCLPTQALAFLVVFVYAKHATQAIAFEWKPGFILSAQYMFRLLHIPSHNSDAFNLFNSMLSSAPLPEVDDMHIFATNKEESEAQMDFRTHRSTIDHLFTLLCLSRFTVAT